MMAGMIPSPSTPTTPSVAPAGNVMSQSMMVPSSSPLTEKNDLMTSSTNSLNMKTGKKYIPSRSRADLAAKEKEREERVRRLKEMQEEDRRKKLEELKQHALHAQRFREQQDHERRRHIEQLRMKDMDRRQQVMERRVDSGSGYWGTRSVSGQTMFERSSTSQERDATDNLRSKRTTSAQGLNVTTEGEDGALSPGVLTAHRRRTDLVPTILMSRTERGAASPATPGSRHRSPGRAVSMSRIDMLSVPRQHGKHVTSVSVSPSKGGFTPSRHQQLLSISVQ